MKNKPSIYRTALPLYFTYFIHGIGVSILSQYKSALQTAWGAADISAVIQVIAADGLLIFTAPFPAMEKAEGKAKSSAGIRRGIVPVVLMGFTATATFTLWLNCNQELGSLYGMNDPSMIQSVYAAGTIVAILATAFVVLKKIDTEDVLVLYPAICFAALAFTYVVKSPVSPLIGGFFIGYGGAGGVLQLVVAEANGLYEEHKGKLPPWL